MSLEIPFGVKTVNPVKLEYWGGPYNSIAEALSTIPLEVRYLTMEVSILDSVNGNEKYWFKDSILDSGLIKFASGGGGGGDVNVIEVIQKNGVALPVSGKTVNITVPTTPSDIGAQPAGTYLQNRGRYEDFTVGDVEVDDVFTNDGIPYRVVSGFTSTLLVSKPNITDTNYFFVLADLKMQDYKAKNAIEHPHWFYDNNPVLANSDDFNFNLTACGSVAARIGYADSPLGSYGAYLWTRESKRVVGIFNNTNYTSGNALPRSGCAVRGVRLATADEMTYDDGTIFHKVYKDVDGNWYSGVKIGTQMWMRENLMTTKLEDGTSIPMIPYSSWATPTGTETLYGMVLNPITNAHPQPSTLTSETLAARYYGYCYTSNVAIDINLLNSGGWRICSKAEWDTLQTYVVTNYPTVHPVNWKKSRGVVNGIFTDPLLVEPRDSKKIDYNDIDNTPIVSFETLVNKTQTINGYQLTGNTTLTAHDTGAFTSGETIQLINNYSGTTEVYIGPDAPPNNESLWVETDSDGNLVGEVYVGPSEPINGQTLWVDTNVNNSFSFLTNNFSEISPDFESDFYKLNSNYSAGNAVSIFGYTNLPKFDTKRTLFIKNNASGDRIFIPSLNNQISGGITYSFTRYNQSNIVVSTDKLVEIVYTFLFTSDTTCLVIISYNIQQ